MKNIFRTILLSFMICLAAASGYAAIYEIDGPSSSVSFIEKHTIGFNSGVIQSFTGTLDFDEKEFLLKQVSLDLHLESLTTFNEARDQLLKSQEFLNVANFSQARIISGKIENGKVNVSVTVLGKTKEYVWDYYVIGLKKSVEGSKPAVALSLTGAINREDFGVDYNVKSEQGQNLLGTEIEFYINLTANKSTN